MNERLISIGKAADELGVHVNTLRDWVNKDKVPAIVLPSGYRRFTRAQLDQIKMDMGLIPKALAA